MKNKQKKPSANSKLNLTKLLQKVKGNIQQKIQDIKKKVNIELKKNGESKKQTNQILCQYLKVMAEKTQKRLKQTLQNASPLQKIYYDFLISQDQEGKKFEFLLDEKVCKYLTDLFDDDSRLDFFARTSLFVSGYIPVAEPLCKFKDFMFQINKSDHFRRYYLDKSLKHWPRGCFIRQTFQGWTKYFYFISMRINSLLQPSLTMFLRQCKIFYDLSSERRMMFQTLFQSNSFLFTII